MFRFVYFGLVLFCALILSPLVMAAPGTVSGQADPAAPKVTESGLPVPRFVTLRSGEVNLRTGPGPSYPVDWVYSKRDLPVEVIAEFDTWRKIRDSDGTEGWVHQTMLSGKRGIVVQGAIRTLRSVPGNTSPPIARAEPGVIGRLIRCDESWCQVEIADHRGWLARGEFWGIYPNEKVE